MAKAKQAQQFFSLLFQNHSSINYQSRVTCPVDDTGSKVTKFQILHRVLCRKQPAVNRREIPRSSGFCTTDEALRLLGVEAEQAAKPFFSRTTKVVVALEHKHRPCFPAMPPGVRRISHGCVRDVFTVLVTEAPQRGRVQGGSQNGVRDAQRFTAFRASRLGLSIRAYGVEGNI